MNLFVADPHWRWWIIGYFFLGGVAAGAYFMATLIDLLGLEEDHGLARVGYWIAFPLICLCGLFLTLDLERPERFWHMLFRSEYVDEALRTSSGQWLIRSPLMKFWSPMSAGSWALMLFGLCSGLSLLGSLWHEGRLSRLFRRGFLGRTLQIVGSLVGFVVAAYTGGLLTATNQPLWSETVWIGALFLTSAASTGIAVMLLLAWGRRSISAGSLARLEKADRWALGLELTVFVVFLVSLGSVLGLVWSTWPGKVLVVGTLMVGILLPLGWHFLVGLTSRPSVVTFSILVLIGGFLFRYAILATPPELLSRGPMQLAPIEPVHDRELGWNVFGNKVPDVSPEAGRPRGGGRGADPGNQLPTFRPRSKVFTSDSP